MSKFKPGDKVVHTQNLTKSFERDRWLGKTLTIEADSGDFFGHRTYTIKEDKVYFFRESELELESVYNSPLYQALK